MELNCQISPDLYILNKYNKLYPWIPNSEQIRPTGMNILMKERMIDKINNEYNSLKDYILIDLFKYDFIKNNKNKYQIIDDINIKLHKFQVCRFKYDIHPKTFHYIMWYTCDKSELIDGEVNKDIRNSIFNIIKDDKFIFVWYENPKMSIPEIYHIQVFWIKLD